jgi:hypothetical protein
MIRENSDGIAKKNPKKKTSVPRYMGCLTSEYTPESANLGRLPASCKAKPCDLNKKYAHIARESIDRIMQTKIGISPLNSVE